MKDIFTDLYNKVLGFFQKQEIEQKENAKDVAYNRLKLVLMQDRTNLTPLLLERMRGEMIDVLSKYVEMDKEALELNLEQEGDSMALMLSIPVLRAREEDEIQAALEAEDKAKAEKEAQEHQESEKTSCETCECNDCDEECELEECKCDTCEFSEEKSQDETIEDSCDEEAECDCESEDCNCGCQDEPCDWAEEECATALPDEDEKTEPKKTKKNKKSK